jgi:hypothetical protein
VVSFGALLLAGAVAGLGLACSGMAEATRLTGTFNITVC